MCSIALADPPEPPAHPPTTDLPSGAGDDAQPTAPAPTQVVPPTESPRVMPLPIVTVSTMPVTKSIPGWWDSAPKTDALIASGVTAVLAGAVIGWWAYRDRYATGSQGNTACVPDFVGGHDINNCFGHDYTAADRIQHKQDVWTYTEFGLGALAGASAFITAAIWARHYHLAREVIVSPTQGGAQVSLTRAF